MVGVAPGPPQAVARQNAVDAASRDATDVLTSAMFGPGNPLPVERSTHIDSNDNHIMENLRMNLSRLQNQAGAMTPLDLVTQQLALLNGANGYFERGYLFQDVTPSLLRQPALVGKLTDILGDGVVIPLLRAIKESMIAKRLIGSLLANITATDVLRNQDLNDAFQRIIHDMTAQ